MCHTTPDLNILPHESSSHWYDQLLAQAIFRSVMPSGVPQFFLTGPEPKSYSTQSYILSYFMSMVEKFSEKELEAIRFIRNALMHHGISPSVREIMNALGYRSPNSAMLVINRLIKAGILRRRRDGKLQIIKDPGESKVNACTIDVPLVGTAPCGRPLLAEENIEMMVPVSIELARPPYRYFLLRTIGDSMDERNIEDGDLVLVRQQNIAESGNVVVALIDGEATIKEFHHSKDAILLKPRSRNKDHKLIIMAEDFQIQGIVVATIAGV